MFIEYYKGMIDAYKNVQDWSELVDTLEELKPLLNEEIEEIKTEQGL